MKVSKKNKKNNKKNNKKKKKKNNYKKSIDNVVLIVFFAILLCIPNRIKLIVNGNRQVTMLWNEEYKEQGATLKRCSFLFCKKIDKKITITGDVDVTKLGTYKVKYSIKYKRRNYDNTRQVTVTEKEMPVIELIGNKELTCSGKKYIEEGYIATDNYDGDITDKVVVKEKKNGIHYFVSDTAQNTIEVIRKRSYEDNETPTIELKGSSEIILSKDTEYKEPGYRAKDNCDGDLTDKVIINGNVDTSKPGEYIITYTVSDGIGNNTSVERKVIVYSFDTDNKDVYIKALNQYIKEKHYNVSIIYYNLKTEYTYKYNENQVYYGASLIKTLAAMYVYENMDVTNTIKSYVKPMIEKSDNQAYLKIERIIGFNNLKEYGLSLGATYTLSGGDEFGDTTVEDQLIYWQHLYELINTIKLKDELKSYFINDYHNHLSFDGAPQIMHKYGYYADVFHDVGIVFDKSPYIVIILTSEANNNYGKIISDLSQKIYKLNQL